MTAKFPAVILLVAGLAVTIPACGNEDSESDTGVDRVRAVVLPYLTQAAFHIAAEEGYFAEQNLDVEFIRLGHIQDVLSALARGDVDVASGFVTANVMNSIARGERIRVVAALGHLAPDACAFNAFLARRELLESGALADPDRLRGLRIDIDISMPMGYWFEEMVRPMGLTLDDFEIISLPPPNAVESLISGSIDITNEAEPYLGVLAGSGEASIWRGTNDIVPNYVFSVMMYSSSLLDERPEVGERFAVATLQAIRQFRLGKTPRNLNLVEGFTGLSAEQVAAACWPTGPVDARVDPSTLMGYQEWATARGLMDRVLNEEELVDHRFIDGANARLAIQ